MPLEVNVGGVTHILNTDFRFGLRTVMAFEDNDLTGEEKVGVMLDNLFLEIPENLEEAVSVSHWFLNAGEELQEESDDVLKLYSFSQDANFIFSAFRQTHGIDLQVVDMHWWKFLALFMDLGSSTAFCNMVAFRKRIYSGKATPEEKAAAREMGDAFEIEQIDTRTLDEKERARIFDVMVKEAKEK